MHWLPIVSVLLGCTDTAPPATVPVDASASTQTQPEPQVTLQRTPRVQVLAVEHVGPYWSLGPVITRVRQKMAEQNATGPLIVRYLRNPRSAPAESLRTQVGFAATGAESVEPPFIRSAFATEWTASRTIDAPAADLARDLAPIYEWIRRHGYKLAGPVTELYFSDADGRTRTELHVAVDLSDPAAREIERLRRLIDPNPPSKPKPARPDSASAPALPQSGQPDTEAARPDAVRTDGPAPDSGAPPPMPTDSTSKTSPATTLPAAPPSPPPIRPIPELAAAGEFDRIARQLIRDDQPIPPDHQIWFAQVVLRLDAVSRGLQQVAPGTGDRLSAMVEPILARSRSRDAAAGTTPIPQPVARHNVHADPEATRKREITRALDVLLARIAQRAADGAPAFDTVAQILQDVQNVLYPPALPPATPDE